MDFADVKVSVANALTISLMVMVVFLVLKWATVKVYIPGFSEAVAAL